MQHCWQHHFLQHGNDLRALPRLPFRSQPRKVGLARGPIVEITKRLGVTRPLEVLLALHVKLHVLVVQIAQFAIARAARLGPGDGDQDGRRQGGDGATGSRGGRCGRLAARRGGDRRRGSGRRRKGHLT